MLLLSIPDVVRLALKHTGWRDWPLVEAIAVAIAESGIKKDGVWYVRPEVINDNPRTGDYSIGIWQNNYIRKLRAERTRKYGPPEGQKDPKTNAITAWRIFHEEGRDSFQPWSSFKTGAHEKYLLVAELAVSEVTGAPMATAEDVLREARKEIGYTESPRGSNCTKFAKEAGHARCTYWCATFTSAILKRCGMHEPNSASTAAILSAYKKRKRFDQNPRPGDVVIYDFPGGRVKNDPSDHIGLVESVRPDGRLTTIEGNTSAGNSGSQSNGGGVFRRVRERTYVVGFGHPNYQEDELSAEDKKALAELKKLVAAHDRQLFTKKDRRSRVNSLDKRQGDLERRMTKVEKKVGT